MVETTEVYVDGEDLVRVVRAPLAQRTWSDEAIVELREWWNSEARSDWAFVPPSVRFLTLNCVADGLGDICEAITRFQIGLVPDLDAEVLDGAREYLWAVVFHEEFGADLIWEQLGVVALECAAEATAEIAAGTYTLHEWREWFATRFRMLPDEFLETAYEALNTDHGDTLDWDSLTCECCGDELQPVDAIRKCFLGHYFHSFKKMMKLITDHPNYLDGLEQYDYGYTRYA